MPFDGLFLHQICQELNQKLLQGRIEKIYQPERELIVLNISQPGQKYRLVLCAHAENNRIHLTTQKQVNPTTPPVFCMVLRKHLEGAKIMAFNQLGLDRVLEIKIDARDELGQPVVKSLICEIMGRHSNIILVSRPDDMILDGVRRYSHAVSRHREVLPGRPYITPPTSNKANLWQLTEHDFISLLLAGSLDDSLAVAMQKVLDGLSIPTSRQIVKLAGLDEKLLLNYCGQHELRHLWQTLQQIRDNAELNQNTCTIVYEDNQNPLDFYPVAVVPEPRFTYSTQGANETADLFYTYKKNQLAFQSEKNQLQNVIKKEQKRIAKKLFLQQQSIAGAQKGDDYRLYGEILTANLYQVQRGMQEIELINYHDPAGSTIIIPLAPEKTGSENAQAYFKKYNKAKNTIQATQKIININKTEKQYLESVAAALNMADNIQDLKEIRRELTGQGYIKAAVTRPGGKKKQKQAEPRPEPVRYQSSDGFTILVGKNNRQNDQLTLKTAQDHDIWLHASKIPGSHVIIRTEGREVPPDTLLAAAQLAAYFSSAQRSSNVPVDYTLRKHVKKPNGARPGYVIYEKQKTLTVHPQKDVATLQ